MLWLALAARADAGLVIAPTTVAILGNLMTDGSSNLMTDGGSNLMTDH